MRRIILIFLVGVALLTIMVVAPVVWQGSDKPAQATPGLVVGFDMNPTGNSCPYDGTDCALGSIETCVEVSAGVPAATASWASGTRSMASQGR